MTSLAVSARRRERIVPGGRASAALAHVEACHVFNLREVTWSLSMAPYLLYRVVTYGPLALYRLHKGI